MDNRLRLKVFKGVCVMCEASTTVTELYHGAQIVHVNAFCELCSPRIINFMLSIVQRSQGVGASREAPLLH